MKTAHLPVDTATINPARPLRVLLIEDNPGDARLVREMLSGSNSYRVQHAERLAQGLEHLEQEPFDIILLDLGLPDNQGIDSLRDLLAAHEKTPVIILTGLIEDRLGIRLIEAGAQDFLPKDSLNKALLERSLHYAIGRQKLLELERASETRFDKLLHASTDAILVVDQQGTILYFNPMAWRLFATGGQELAGSPFGVPLVGGESIEIEIAGNGSRTAELRTAPIEWQGAPAHLVMVHDITDRKRVEQMLRASGKELEARVAERTAALHRLNAELQEREERLKTQQAVLMKLAADASLMQGRVDEALLFIARTAADTLNVRRASVWLFNADDSALECQVLYDREQQDRGCAPALPAAEHGRFISAVEESQVVAVQEARDDDRTRSLYRPYLQAAGVDALLAAAIISEADTIGIFCVEHAADRRRWELDEQSFATSVADMVAMALLQAEHRKDEESLRLAAKIVESTTEGVMVTDAQGVIQNVNPAFTQITGYPVSEAIGKNPRLLRSGVHDTSFFAEMWRVLDETGHWRGEVWNRRRDGAVLPMQQTVSAIRDAQGRITHYVSVFHDISERVQKEEQTRHQAYHDPLTGLPNRLLFLDRLQMALSEARRHQRILAVLFLDLDKFKPVNDNYGHLAGDQLLQEVARRLLASVREEDTVSRLGGDEFTLLLSNLANPRDAEVVANNILRAFDSPFSLGGFHIRAACSIGIACFPGDGEQPEALLERADAAMYRAKAVDRSCYVFASEDQ